jgi:hypothetical protein
MKKKKSKTIILGEEWIAGEETKTDIRPDNGIIHRRCITQEVDVLDANTKKTIKQLRKILEQKITWADGQEHILPRVLMD